MDPTLQWLIVVIAVLAAGAALWIALQKNRTRELRDRFGPEYDRALHQEGGVRKAEAELAARAQRVQALQIRPLDRSDAVRFDHGWRHIQTRFVDDPRGAVSAADRLIGEVMMARGYPVGDFDQRVSDISVDHPDVVMNYRAARDIALQHARGEATTEDLRRAMVHYRALFTELLEAPPAPAPQPEDRHFAGRRSS